MKSSPTTFSIPAAFTLLSHGLHYSSKSALILTAQTCHSIVVWPQILIPWDDIIQSSPGHAFTPLDYALYVWSVLPLSHVKYLLLIISGTRKCRWWGWGDVSVDQVLAVQTLGIEFITSIALQKLGGCGGSPIIPMTRMIWLARLARLMRSGYSNKPCHITESETWWRHLTSASGLRIQVHT